MHLEIKNLHTYYGLVHMLKGVSLNVNEGEIISILGRNGAGKTTTIKSIMGLAPSSDGSVILKGEEITNFEPHEVAKKGISFVPASRGIFSTLTAYENLKIFHLKHSKWNIDDVFKLFPKLEKLKFRNGNSLSGGEQQMLAIGRSLVINPSVIMLDEPSQGLAPEATVEMTELIRKLSKKYTILLIEHKMHIVMEISKIITVLNFGEKIEEGTPNQIKNSKKVQDAYLGRK